MNEETRKTKLSKITFVSWITFRPCQATENNGNSSLLPSACARPPRRSRNLHQILIGKFSAQFNRPHYVPASLTISGEQMWPSGAPKRPAGFVCISTGSRPSETSESRLDHDRELTSSEAVGAWTEYNGVTKRRNLGRPLLLRSGIAPLHCTPRRSWLFHFGSV